MFNSWNHKSGILCVWEKRRTTLFVSSFFSSGPSWSLSAGSPDAAAAPWLHAPDQHVLCQIRHLPPTRSHHGRFSEKRQLNERNSRLCVQWFLNCGLSSTNAARKKRTKYVSTLCSVFFAPQRVYRALYDYAAQDHDEVSFRDGDIIINAQPIDEGWMYGTVQRTGKSGMLPANYVECYN